jgi:hypothetical protein
MRIPSLPIPTPLDCEILDWFAARHGVRWSSVPRHWRRRAHKLADVPDHPAWLERESFHIVRITAVGRTLAAAYRHGRAAAPTEQHAASR